MKFSNILSENSVDKEALKNRLKICDPFWLQLLFLPLVF